jgi:Zn-dependent protease
LREKGQIAVFFVIQKITATIIGYVAMVNCLLASTNLGRFGMLHWV